jgi:hypothetical protein
MAYLSKKKLAGIVARYFGVDYSGSGKTGKPSYASLGSVDGHFILYVERCGMGENRLELMALSSLSEEQVIELCRLYNPLPFASHQKTNTDYRWIVSREEVKGFVYFKVSNKKNDYSFQIDAQEGSLEMYLGDEPCEVYSSAAVIDQLRAWGFMVPCDGIDLFKEGLAVLKKPII